VPAQQTVLDATAKPALSSYWQLYQKIDRLPVGIEKSVRAQRVSEDRSVREAAWRRHWKIADAKADADASLLFGIVKQQEATAHLKNYPDAASAGYASRDLTRAEVQASLAAVQANLSLYQSYQRLNAMRLKRTLAIADSKPWDMDMLKSAPSPHFTFADVRKIAPHALTPLGAAYVQHFSALLAPSSGRVDIASKVGNREAGGFSVNAPGLPSALYMATFTGSADDVRVVIHEGGHAVAAQFANESGTPSFYASGPDWLMESYAILNEFLLYDYLARTSPSPADRRYYANALLDDMMFQVFGSAEEATLEQSIDDGVDTGEIQSAADLDACAYRVMKGFEPWSDDILHASSALWSRKRLIFQDPFYLVNYMYAGIIAINLYQQAKLHPGSFPVRYDALLRRGYDAPPMTLLAPLLGKGISTATLTTSAFGVMRDQLNKISPPAGSSSAATAH
jgi:oligoendopeptidase F